MMSIGTFVVISVALTLLSGELLWSRSLSWRSAQPSLPLSPRLAIVTPPNPFAEPGVNVETAPCRSEPIGLGIPGFQPGIHRDRVMQMFGVPNKMLPGYWPNTHAVSYELIPNQVSLGFLFDKDSQLLRQTEAAFTPNVQTEIVLGTLNSMLGCQLNPEITSGFQRVWQGEIRSYSFSLGSLNGAIHWERREGDIPQGDRIYIGIWEAGLHR